MVGFPYSTYLVHVPLVLASVLLPGGIVPIGILLVCVPPVAIVLGWLFHETVAGPCMRLGQRLATCVIRRPITALIEVTQPTVG